MRGFATSPNPFATGIRPRTFLGARRDQMRLNIMINGIGKKEYDKINKDRNTQSRKGE